MRETEATQLEAPEAFATGDRVFHVKFGDCTVVGIQSKGRILVDFDKAGEKRIARDFQEMRRPTAEIIAFPTDRIVRTIHHGRGMVVK